MPVTNPYFNWLHKVQIPFLGGDAGWDMEWVDYHNFMTESIVVAYRDRKAKKLQDKLECNMSPHIANTEPMIRWEASRLLLVSN